MTAKHFILVAMGVALIYVNCSRSAVAATPSHDGDMAAARNFIRDSLKQSDSRAASYFYWPDKAARGQPVANAPLVDVRITSTTVTFVTDPAFEFEFPLKNFSLSVGKEVLRWGGPVTLRIVGNPSRVSPATIGRSGEHLIALSESLSGTVANKIAADFAMLSQAAIHIKSN